VVVQVSVHNIPTIVNGDLSVINQSHGSSNDNNKWIHVRSRVKESEVKMQENKVKEIRGLKHKILIIGDSHVRDFAGLMSASLDAHFEVCGVVKLGSCTSGTMTDEVDKLSNNDFVMLCSGSNDISKKNPRLAFRFIVDSIEKVKHTNVILLGLPPRFDASDCSYLNNVIKHFNSKLSKLAKMFSHVTMSEMATDRLFYTRQDLHLNVLDKELVVNSWDRIYFYC
jgi:hypothetical protein